MVRVISVISILFLCGCNKVVNLSNINDFFGTDSIENKVVDNIVYIDIYNSEKIEKAKRFNNLDELYFSFNSTYAIIFSAEEENLEYDSVCINLHDGGREYKKCYDIATVHSVSICNEKMSEFYVLLHDKNYDDAITYLSTDISNTLSEQEVRYLFNEITNNETLEGYDLVGFGTNSDTAAIFANCYYKDGSNITIQHNYLLNGDCKIIGLGFRNPSVNKSL